MKTSLRLSLAFALATALMAVSCKPKVSVEGDDGGKGDPGPAGPAGPTGPAGAPGSTDAWSRTGNAGTVPGANFLGTTDPVAFEIHADGSRVARFDPESAAFSTAFGANVILGSAGNSVGGGAVGCVIEGGGSYPGILLPNVATDDFCVVGGGTSNVAGNSGGTTSDAANSVVAGGSYNSATGANSTVSGGSTNSADGYAATIGGGYSNSTTGNFSVVCGGTGNTAGLSAFMGGGSGNSATGTQSVVVGGSDNTASGDHAIVGGGFSNMALSAYAAILGGSSNVASGNGSTIPGGIENETQGACALAAGRKALTLFDGSFVWADVASVAGVDGDPFRSDARANQFNAFASGGVRFVTRYDGSGHPVAAAELAPGGSSWLSLLDESSVAAVRPLDTRQVLRQLRLLPLSSWSFAAQDASVRHVGPLAKDFSAAFGLGESDRHIGHLDAEGVALASIQGLCLELEERDARIEALETRSREQEAGMLEAMSTKEARIATLESRDAESSRRISDLEDRLDRMEKMIQELRQR